MSSRLPRADAVEGRTREDVVRIAPVYGQVSCERLNQRETVEANATRHRHKEFASAGTN